MESLQHPQTTEVPFSPRIFLCKCRRALENASVLSLLALPSNPTTTLNPTNSTFFVLRLPHQRRMVLREDALLSLTVIVSTLL